MATRELDQRDVDVNGLTYDVRLLWDSETDIVWLHAVAFASPEDEPTIRLVEPGQALDALRHAAIFLGPAAVVTTS